MASKVVASFVAKSVHLNRSVVRDAGKTVAGPEGKRLPATSETFISTLELLGEGEQGARISVVLPGKHEVGERFELVGAETEAKESKKK